MQVADQVVSYLADCGIRRIFGHPETPLEPLLDAIERDPRIDWVPMRHESSAALVAAADARLTGGLGVCIAGSGALDLGADRVPLLALSHRSGASVAPEQLIGLVRERTAHALQEREAVHLALPSEVLAVEVDPALGALPCATPMLMPPGTALDAVAADLAGRERVAIVVGRRALGSGPAIEALAERLVAPLITALDGKGIVDEPHPSALVGFPGIKRSRAVLADVDAVLAFGVDDLGSLVNGANDVAYECEPDFSFVSRDHRRDRTLVGPLDMIAYALRERLPVLDRAAQLVA